MALAETILGFLSEPSALLLYVAVTAVLTGVAGEIILHALMKWVEKKHWWPRAMPLQKGMMMKGGYPEASCTDNQVLTCYAYVIFLCSHHILCGSMMMPVVIYGWTGAQAMGQVCFVIGALMDVSVDVYDEFRMFSVTFLHDSVGKKLFGGEKCPKALFIVLGVLHHPLAMTMVCPMVLYYPDVASFHITAVSLLLAAGVCFTTGSYKLTLDLSKAWDWYQFKAIVTLQAGTIFYTRGYLWFVHLYFLLSKFRADANMGFFYGGCAAGLLMSLFNVIMIADALGAAVKWLPRGRVQEGSEEQHELNEDVISVMPPTPSKGTANGSLKLASSLGLISTFRTDVKVLVAAAKFKKSLKKRD